MQVVHHTKLKALQVLHASSWMKLCLCRHSNMTRVQWCVTAKDQLVYQQVVHQQVALSGKEHRKDRVPSIHKYKPADMYLHQTDMHAHSRLFV